MTPNPFPHEAGQGAPFREPWPGIVTGWAGFPLCRHCESVVFAAGAPGFAGWVHLQDTECEFPCPITWPCDCDWDDDEGPTPDQINPFWPLSPRPTAGHQLALFEGVGS